MDSIANDVTVPRPNMSASGGQLKNSDRQPGAEAEQNEVRKEQQMINELAQQKVKAGAVVSTNQSSVAGVQAATEASHSAAKSNAQSSRAPNWSQLSAQVNGYTQLQRAMNLYQRINNLA
ncbi:MAG TPA: hypothetical protein VKY35_04775 [Aliidiomarina sp.]|nr:hypothetical protein [Aliidiomarina sp.]